MRIGKCPGDPMDLWRVEERQSWGSKVVAEWGAGDAGHERGRVLSSDQGQGVPEAADG